MTGVSKGKGIGSSSKTGGRGKGREKKRKATDVGSLSRMTKKMTTLSVASPSNLYVICCYPFSSENHTHSIYKINVTAPPQTACDDVLFHGEQLLPRVEPFITFDRNSFPEVMAMAIVKSKLFIFGGGLEGERKDVYVLDHMSSDFERGGSLKADLPRKSCSMNGVKRSPVALVVKEGEFERICVFSVIESKPKDSEGPNFELFHPDDEAWRPLPDPPVYGTGKVRVKSYYIQNSKLFISTMEHVMFFINLKKPQQWNMLRLSSRVSSFPFQGRATSIGLIGLTAYHMIDFNLKSDRALAASSPILDLSSEELKLDVVPYFPESGGVCCLSQNQFLLIKLGLPIGSALWLTESTTYPYLQVDLIHQLKGKSVATAEFRRVKTLRYRLTDHRVEPSLVGCFSSAV